MKSFFPIALVMTVFLTGCSTVKRAPVPVSEVRLFEAKGGIIQNQKNVRGPYPDPTTGVFTYGVRTITVSSMIPASDVIENSQYIGQVHWSGTLPELDIPESAYDTGISGGLQFVPDRVKEAVKERAAEKGANLVILEVAGGNYRWVMEDGKFQPYFLLYAKAYFRP